MEEVGTLIVGGGIAGLTTAWHHARAGGEKILLLESERLLGTHSSGRNAAILRTVGPDPLTTSLSLRSARTLRRPPAGFAQVPLIDPSGLFLVADTSRGATLASWVETAGPDSGSVEVSPEEFHRQVPFYGGEAARVFSFPQEGRLDIAALVAGFAEGSRAAGVTIRRGVPVKRLSTTGDRVTGVELEDGTCIAAATTVMAAGGWAGRLGETAGSRVVVTPTRRHLLITKPHESIDPGWPVIWALGDEFYCRPESGGMLLCACDQSVVDPSDCRRDDHVCEIIAEKMTRLLPGLGDMQVARFWCGLRTMTRDDRFALGPDPDLAGLFWVAGLGGHGMVCSFEIGHLAARRLQGGEPVSEEERALDPARLVEASV
jgi:glycine/D-amino acid oxidase-like deaminating enzyme